MAEQVVEREHMVANALSDDHGDVDLVLQRYNSQLPLSYRFAIVTERKLLLRALRCLVEAIVTPPQNSQHNADPTSLPPAPTEEVVSEGYQHEIERDFATLEKGITRFLDMKHAFDESDYPLFFNAVLRGALTPNLDMGLRSKLTRSASRILGKLYCTLPNGAPWRRIVRQIRQVHIDCVDGVNYIGKDVRESHCRNMLNLLAKSRQFLAPDDSAEKIWDHFSSGIRSSDPDVQFENVLFLTYVMPTQGDAWTGWVPEAMRLWQLYESSNDWDAVWMTMASRVSRSQPCVHDWTPYLPWIYTRIEDACHLPIGAMSPQGSIDRRCPSHICFLLEHTVIPGAAKLCTYSLSPKYPAALHFLKRFFALIANYFHPSNSGRWSGSIGAFMSSLTSALLTRVIDERNATKARITDRVLGNRHRKGVAPAEHRLSEEYITEIMNILLPLIDLGLHSKVHSLSIQAASSARDLSIIRPLEVIPPLLQKASEGLESISSPHRTTAALRLLSTLTPVFLDSEIFPDGLEYLPQALQLTLPGVDPNDPGKTESTLRFIGGAAARIQGLVNEDPMPIPEAFFDDYMQQFLERIFSLLDSLEAPPKKNANGNFGAPQPLSYIIFDVAIENLFVCLPPSVAISSARKVVKQLTGAACSNAMKYYGSILRAACAVVSNAMNDSFVEIFIPPLLDQLFENVADEKPTFVSVGDDELVWRIRMLAQACRYCGCGIRPYISKIMRVVEIAFEQPQRTVYKSGGRLLRGLFEGLNNTQMIFDVGNGDKSEVIESRDGAMYKMSWRVPSKEDWKLTEDILTDFVAKIEEICPISESSTSEEIIAQRDVIFRVLRMLHAAQRAGRWLLSGALPERFRDLDKYVDDDVKLSKPDAKLILKRPVKAGLGGEREDNGVEFASKMWDRIYSISFKIMSIVIKKRPDDGALLYRCLEPLELAHEPFRRGSMTRNTTDAASSFKSAHRSIVASKRPFGAEGGVGRAMPRFIMKLRVDAHHEMRLTVAGRAGLCATKLSDDLVSKLTEFSLNDFPRVRGEARGVLTRALRVIKPEIRLREITRIIEVLRTSSSKAKSQQQVPEQEMKDSAGDLVMTDTNSKKNHDQSTDGTLKELPAAKKSKDDVLYEKMIGSCSVLRSSAAAPIILRNTRLFSQVMRAFIEAMPKAERPDAAASIANLFHKLSSQIRPLSIDPIRILNGDLETVPDVPYTASEEKQRKVRLEAYNELNNYLLSMVKSGEAKIENSKDDGEMVQVNGKEATPPAKKAEAHWRVQSLVAIILLILIREDIPPACEVAEFFTRGIVSDVVALRHICSRAVSLILALHGRKAGIQIGSNTDKNGCNGLSNSSPAEWEKAGAVTIAKIGNILCDKEFMKKVVHTLALDHDEDDEGSYHRGGDLFAMLSYTRVADGESCWTGMGGRPWPTSWTPRSRDSLHIVRIRFYEGLVRVYGTSLLDALLPCAKELVSKLESKQERLISGVKDEDVRVLTAEILAAICRGLDVSHCGKGTTYEKDLSDATKLLLSDMTGPMGNTNGASLIRLIATAESFTIGPSVMKTILAWQLKGKPLIVEMGNGPHAHLQARRLRYIHSCVADINDPSDNQMVSVVANSVPELLGETGLNHGLKTVREEVGRLLGLLSVSVSSETEGLFMKSIKDMSQRLLKLEQIDSVEKNGLVEEGEEKAEDETKDESTEKKTNEESELARKSRSRQGETLSRFVSIVYWNGRARVFEQFVCETIQTLFRSFDESDQERISHAKMALSLLAQGCFSQKTLEGMISAAEETVKDRRWKVRASVLIFLQILSFCSLFLASEELLRRIRQIVFGLLSDSQIEVRQSAAAAFVTMIRDADNASVQELRDTCLEMLRETSWRQRSRRRANKNAAKNKKPVLEGEKLFRRHGAVLGLSSMVTGSPYSVPEWMPAVLVALADCVNDPPPICTGVRELFADFMRTHRDEWQTHKLAFSPDELEVVSELLVSPTYYA